MSSDEPLTLWEVQDGVRSGGGGMIRAASFAFGDTRRAGIALTVRVPDGFWQAVNGGGMTATLLLDADEARGFAAWLEEAAAHAERSGPPLYGTT